MSIFNDKLAKLVDRAIDGDWVEITITGSYAIVNLTSNARDTVRVQVEKGDRRGSLITALQRALDPAETAPATA